MGWIRKVDRWQRRGKQTEDEGWRDELFTDSLVAMALRPGEARGTQYPRSVAGAPQTAWKIKTSHSGRNDTSWAGR